MLDQAAFPVDESCCSTAVVRSDPRRCPRCGTRGHSVDGLAVAAMMSGVVPLRQGYWLCREPECDAVYFGEDATLLTSADMNVAPGFKSRSPEALVCYCFQHRRRDIEAELLAEGCPHRRTAPASWRASLPATGLRPPG